MEVEGHVEESAQRPPKRKHGDIGISGKEDLPQSRRVKGNGGWVSGDTDDDGVARHTHSASGRVMIEVSSGQKKQAKEDEKKKLSPREAWTITPKVADMPWRLTPKIVVAAVRGNISMAKDALTNTTQTPAEGKAAVVDAVATANMFDGLVSGTLKAFSALPPIIIIHYVILCACILW